MQNFALPPLGLLNDCRVRIELVIKNNAIYFEGLSMSPLEIAGSVHTLERIESSSPAIKDGPIIDEQSVQGDVTDDLGPESEEDQEPKVVTPYEPHELDLSVIGIIENQMLLPLGLSSNYTPTYYGVYADSRRKRRPMVMYVRKNYQRTVLGVKQDCVRNASLKISVPQRIAKENIEYILSNVEEAEDLLDSLYPHLNRYLSYL